MSEIDTSPEAVAKEVKWLATSQFKSYRDSGDVLSALAADRDRLAAENARLREALEIVAGKRQCLDNLMSNAEVARAALSKAGG